MSPVRLIASFFTYLSKALCSLLLASLLIALMQPVQGNAPKPPDLRSRLKDCLADGDADGALKLLSDPGARQLRQVDRLKFLHEASAMKGDNKAAMEALEKLMVLEPDNGEYLFLRAALFRSEKQYDKALQDYNQILARKAGKSPWALIERSAVYRALGKNQQALTDLTAASMNEKVEFEAWREACNLCIKMGKHQEAIGFAGKLIKQAPGESTYYVIRAREFAKLNNLAAASRDLRTAESMDPEDRAEINLVRQELLKVLPSADK